MPICANGRSEAFLKSPGRFDARCSTCVAWILHWLRLETLVRQRTAELEKAWDRERIAEVQARKAADKLDRMHCVSVVGELSSILRMSLDSRFQSCDISREVSECS